MRLLGMVPPDPFGKISAYARFWLIVYVLIAYLMGAGYWMAAPTWRAAAVAAVAPVSVPALLGAALAQ